MPTITPASAVLFPNETVVFMCNITTSPFIWVIDDDNFFTNQLPNGTSSNGTSLFVTMSDNATLYGCGSITPDSMVIRSEKSILLVAG